MYVYLCVCVCVCVCVSVCLSVCVVNIMFIPISVSAFKESSVQCNLMKD